MESMPSIPELIPHRPPFLFIDRILALTDRSIATEKAIRADEQFLQGHYPGRPIMPGVLICEAVFQSACALIMSRISRDERTDVLPVVTKINQAKFKKMVLPGMTININVELTERMKNFCIFKGRVAVGSQPVGSVEFTCALLRDDQGTS